MNPADLGVTAPLAPEVDGLSLLASTSSSDSAPPAPVADSLENGLEASARGVTDGVGLRD